VSATPLSRRALFRAAGLAGAAAVLPLAGCGSVPSSQNGVTTLRFMQNKPEVVAYFNQVIKDFEALNPDIRVIQDFNEGNFVPGLVRNDPPDVVTRGFAQATADFVRKGVFADLSDLPAAATIDPKIQDLVSSWGQYNGHETSALPFSLAAAGVIYRRDIFEAQGVSVPTTWDEFVAACEKFKAAGITPIYGTFKDNWTLGQGIFDYVAGGALDIADFFARLTGKGAAISADAAESFTSNFGPVLPRCWSWLPSRRRAPRARTTRMAMLRSPRARRRCTCRARGRFPSLWPPTRTSGSAASHCPSRTTPRTPKSG
jgi:raffinose/stachyose/melibiose transport system substrate-binding protein